MKKICFAASSGGHFEQLLMLRPLMDKYDSFILTEKTGYAVLSDDRRAYYLSQVNRKEKTWLFAMLKNAVKTLGIILKERPDAVICTGVLAMIPTQTSARPPKSARHCLAGSATAYPSDSPDI